MLRPEAKRNILVAGWEEDALPDVLSELIHDFGGAEAQWLAAIQEECVAGALAAYRFAEDSGEFAPVIDLPGLSDAERWDHSRAVYLTRTAFTLRAILALPPPPRGDSRWIIDLWGPPPR